MRLVFRGHRLAGRWIAGRRAVARRAVAGRSPVARRVLGFIDGGLSGRSGRRFAGRRGSRPRRRPPLVQVSAPEQQQDARPATTNTPIPASIRAVDAHWTCWRQAADCRRPSSSRSESQRTTPRSSAADGPGGGPVLGVGARWRRWPRPTTRPACPPAACVAGSAKPQSSSDAACIHCRRGCWVPLHHRHDQPPTVPVRHPDVGVAGVIGEAGLAAQRARVLVEQLVVVRGDVALTARRRHPDVHARHDLRERWRGHVGLGEQRQVVGRRRLTWAVEAGHGRGPGVQRAERLGGGVHVGDGLVVPAVRPGQRVGGVVAGDDHQVRQQLADRVLAAGLDADPGAVLIRVVCSCPRRPGRGCVRFFSITWAVSSFSVLAGRYRPCGSFAASTSPVSRSAITQAPADDVRGQRRRPRPARSARTRPAGRRRRGGPGPAAGLAAAAPGGTSSEVSTGGGRLARCAQSSVDGVSTVSLGGTYGSVFGLRTAAGAASRPQRPAPAPTASARTRLRLARRRQLAERSPAADVPGHHRGPP